MNLRYTARLIGLLMIVLAVAMSTSMIWSVVYNEIESIWSFAYSVGITIICGLLLILVGVGKKGDLYIKEAFVITAFGWIFAGIFGALPYIFEGTFDNFISAFFESVSGFTTTGSTAMVIVEESSRALLYWRSLTQWLGGMGIIVLFIAILPRLGVGAKHLFKSEVPGPITDNFRPKLKETSSILWRIYVGFTLLETLVLWLLDMSFYDAICHSLTTMSTGGFSTLTASVAGFHNPAIEYAICFFMFVAGVNFYLYYVAVRGDFQNIFRDYEFRAYAFIVLVVTIIVTINILPIHQNILDSFRYAIFQTVGLITTTGFGTDNFDVYPDFVKLILIILMFIGGMAGSTAGGMKISRVIVLLRVFWVELFKAARPNAVVAIRIGDNTVPDKTVSTITGFFVIFIIVFAVGTIFMAALGFDIITAFSSVVATFANIGPGLGNVGSLENYADIPAAGKLFLSLLMIMGRLELFTVLALLLPSFWRR